VTMLWHLPLQVVLAEMGRRPRPGVDTRTIARELHTSMDGHVLRSLAEGRPPGTSRSDSAEAVGRHTLLLLEGFTEPDEPVPHPPDGPLDAWVRDTAAHLIAQLHRDAGPEGAPGSDSTSPTFERSDVLAALRERCPGERDAELRRSFDEQLPDLHALREAALERCLRPRVDAVKAMYEMIAPVLQPNVIPGPVLRQLVSTIRAAASSDGNLLRCCRDHHKNGAPSYLTELEGLLQDLLAGIDTPRPGDIAGSLLGQALDGDHPAVEALLMVIIPDDEDELAALQAAAADQVR
jgi:hypothetical protein